MGGIMTYITGYLGVEPWFVYAALSGVFSGLYSFSHKISAEKNHSSMRATFYTSIAAAAMSLGVFIVQGGKMDPLYILLGLGILNSIGGFTSVIARIHALKYIDTTIFFPLYKTFGPILIVGISIWGFGESMKLNEWIGIGLGIAVPLLLIHKSEHTRQCNLKKGLLLLGVSVIFVLSPATIAKIITLNDLNVFLYQFYAFLCSAIFAWIGCAREVHTACTHSHSHVKITGLFGGMCLFLGASLFLLSTRGNLGVVYTVNSFSIMIPIILAVIVYKEHINARKVTAIVLTVTSLIFLH